MKMEIWDPFTGEIQFHTSRLPQETSLDIKEGISNFKFLSMNHNTELLFVGGIILVQLLMMSGNLDT